MKRKNLFALGVLWAMAVVAVIALWLVLSPASPPATTPALVSVSVAPATEPPPSPMMPPPPVMPPLAENLPQGDERVQAPAETTELVNPAPLSPPVALLGHAPHIALVIDDMGLDLKGSRRAMALPAAVTLSFLPYATRLQDQTLDAQNAGHELLLHMPMEPLGRDDPGPHALRVDQPIEDIRQEFQTALASFTGFDGVNNHMGSKFTAYATGMDIVMDELRQRNLFFLDSRTGPRSVGMSLAAARGVRAVSRDVFLDDEIATQAISKQLAIVERIARRKGYAVAIGHPHALTLQALEKWMPEAEQRGVVFVPLHKLVPSVGEQN